LAILLVILRESKWTTEESDYGVHPVDAKIVEAGFKPASAVLPVGQVFNPTDPFQDLSRTDRNVCPTIPGVS